MASNFEIRESLPGTVSGTLPSGSAIKVGIALMVNAKDADTGINTFALASGRADGFLTKSVATTAGLTANEIAFGLQGYSDTDGSTGEIATPFLAGGPGSVERAQSLEVEGSDYIFGSGTGAITTGTTAGTVLSFTSGKFYVAQSNDWAQYRLVAQMTPTTVGNTRIFVEKIEAYKVA